MRDKEKIKIRYRTKRNLFSNNFKLNFLDSFHGEINEKKT